MSDDKGHTTYYIGFEDDEGVHRIGQERIRFTGRRATVRRGGTTLGALRRTYYRPAAVQRMEALGTISRTKLEAVGHYLKRLGALAEDLELKAGRARIEYERADRHLSDLVISCLKGDTDG